MDNTLLVLMIGAVVVAAILLVRRLRCRDSVGYQRRFVNGAPASGQDSRHDEAFPFASTLYLGDGGSSSHSHHSHAADCAPTSDAGGGCSDGGGGGSH
jgi:uncharacterized membrane protein YgcG